MAASICGPAAERRRCGRGAGQACPARPARLNLKSRGQRARLGRWAPRPFISAPCLRGPLPAPVMYVAGRFPLPPTFLRAVSGRPPLCLFSRGFGNKPDARFAFFSFLRCGRRNGADIEGDWNRRPASGPLFSDDWARRACLRMSGPCTAESGSCRAPTDGPQARVSLPGKRRAQLSVGACSSHLPSSSPSFERAYTVVASIRGCVLSMNCAPVILAAATKLRVVIVTLGSMFALITRCKAFCRPGYFLFVAFREACSWKQIPSRIYCSSF